MKRAPLLLLLVLLASRLHAQAPRLEPGAGDWAVLTSLPPLLGREEVRKQLGTGLTTTLAFHVRATGGGRERVEGGARIDIRYELWDEVYLVSGVDATGRATRNRFPSFDRLSAWWREARFEVARLPRPAGGPPWKVEVRLRVIPFSQSEQIQAQRWLSDSLTAREPGSAGAVAEAAEDQPATFSQVLSLLMAASLQRTALFESEWNLTFPAGPQGRGRR